jgi:hypothetical protein
MWLKVASDRNNLMAQRLLSDYSKTRRYTPEQVAEGEKKAKEFEVKNPAPIASVPLG